MSFDTWTLDHQLYALLGSVSHMLTFIWSFKQLKDKKKTKHSWNEFWGTSWDDLIMIPFLGQVMVFMLEYLFGLYAYNISEETSKAAWAIFFDNIEAASFLIGIFGSIIFIEILNIGRMAITLISRKMSKLIRKQNE